MMYFDDALNRKKQQRKSEYMNILLWKYRNRCMWCVCLERLAFSGLYKQWIGGSKKLTKTLTKHRNEVNEIINQALEIAAKPFGTSANFKPADGER